MYNRKGKSKPKTKCDNRERTTKEETTSKQRSASNDPAWYANNEQLLRDTASIPFSWPQGSKIPYVGTPGSSPSDVDALVRFPGIMRLDFVPTVGYAEDAFSAINVASRNLFSFVRKANSGSANYEAPDMMMYIMAMDSLIMWHNELKRAYGVARLYNTMNRYYGAALLEALGFDADDVYSNLAQFRAQINNLAVKLGALNIPAGMPIISRHSFMTSGVYLDGNTTKSQMFVFVPQGYYVYDNTGTTGTELHLNGRNARFSGDPTYSTKLTVAECDTITQTLLDVVMNDEDFNIMSGDIGKAFNDRVYQHTLIAEDFVILPSYDPLVLSQIENANVLPISTFDSYSDSFVATISQDPSINHGYLTTSYKFSTDTGWLSTADITGAFSDYVSLPVSQAYSNTLGTQLINLHVENPTPEDVIEATRLMPLLDIDVSGKDASTPQYAFEVKSVGADFLTGVYVYTTSPSASGYTDSYEYSTCCAENAFEAVKGCRASSFHHAPMCRLLDGIFIDQAWPNDHMGVKGVVTAYLGDIANYTTISADTLRSLHDTAMLSMFAVPLTGMSTK